MATTPQDYTDLFLSPVALQIDHELQDLAELERDELRLRVDLAADRDAKTRMERARDILRTVTQFVDLHGWLVDWDPRGLRLSHGSHALVLGVPRNVLAYVNELDE